MRLLRINGQNVDLDESTAIGVTYQGYDIKSPAVRKVKISNSFTIPKTDNNLQIFGYPQNPQSISKKVYGKNIANYWVDNEQLITNAKVRADSVGKRIKIFVFQKDDVWDSIKKVLWPDFVKDFVKWMQEENSLPSKENPFIGSFSDFITPYTTAEEGIKLPFSFGNLYNYAPYIDSEDVFLEDFNSLYLRFWPDGSDENIKQDKADGGHFFVYCKTIFQYIEYKYDVDFLTSGGVKVGNIWDDQIAPKLYIPVKDLGIRFSYSGSSISGFYFEFNEDTKFLPLKDQKDKADKKLYDFAIAFMQIFNIVQDDFGDNQTRLARFDDITTLAEVTDWSGNYTNLDDINFEPSINGFSQENTIKFKTIHEEGDELLNSKTLTCLNKNLDASNDLFSIDAYVPSFLNIVGGVVPDLSPKEAFKTFCFMLDSGLTEQAINIYSSENGNEQSAIAYLQKPALYSLDSEYNTLDSIIKYPRYYEVDRWLTLNDVKDLEYFRLYWIKELNGSYFLNKISGFNPQKANKATKLELIYVNDKTPVTPPTLDYWADGVNDAFTDGDGDYWF